MIKWMQFLKLAVLPVLALTVSGAIAQAGPSTDEPPPAPPVDFSTISDTPEIEPADRIDAANHAYGQFFSEEFKLRGIAELARLRKDYPDQMPGATHDKDMPVWESIGPRSDKYIYNGVLLTKIVDSGRVATILPDPSNNNTVYVLTSGGGLWKTSNFAAPKPNWKPKTDALVSTSGGAVAFGRNPDVLYLGIGDSFDVLGLIAGVFVKSTDGGETWSPLVSLPGASAVRDVKVDTSGPTDVVLVATDVGVFRSTDAGATFALVLPNKSAWSLARSSAGWLATTQSFTGDGMVFRSPNVGATWAPVTVPPSGSFSAGIGRITLGVAVPGDAAVYAFAGNRAGNDQDDLYVSRDGGQTFSSLAITKKIPSNPNCYQPNMNVMHAQAYYNQMLIVDPGDTTRSTLYIGGNFSGAKSTDGGSTWKIVSNWLPGACFDGSTDTSPYVHADFHAGAVAKIAGKPVVIFGTDGGLFMTADGGTTFQDKNTGLVTHLTQTVVSSSRYEDVALTGLQDDGTRARVGESPVWNQVIGGDGEGAGWSQANNAVALGSVQMMRIRRYENLGPNPPPGGWAQAVTGIGGLDFYPFYTPIATPTGTADHSGLVFFSSTGSKVYRTVDGAKNWTPIFVSALPGGYPVPVFNMNHQVIGVHPKDINRIAMAGTGGRVYITTDGGANWTVRSLKTLVTGYGGINISPSWGPGNTLYMASANLAAGAMRVVKSNDNGVTWARADGGLPDVALSQILVDPRDASGNTAYVASWIGVFATRNGGAHWSLLGAGLPNVWARGLGLTEEGVLRVATYGRGIWELAADGGHGQAD